MKLNIADIVTAPWNTRGEITPESVKDLAESIKAQGLINPITVWMSEDGDGWYCIAGNRRLAALRAIGADEAEVTEFKGSEHEAKMVTVVENLQREAVSPFDEAALIEQCLDDGMTAASIATKTGRSTSWVNRRRRLIGLVDAWKARVGEIELSALERIAAYPTDVQERVAKCANWCKTWKDIARYFDIESRGLDAAKFDTSACAKCLKRTGAEADLFDVVDGKLGRCLDCACFDKKRQDWKDAEIEAAVDDAEFVDVKYEWQMPNDTTPKPDKAHSCAYICENVDGEIKVRWGASVKEREEAEAKAREEREAADAERREKRERIDAIVAKLEDLKDTDGAIDALVSSAVNLGDENAVGYAIEATVDKIVGWHSDEDWADIIRNFPNVAKAAELTDEEVAEFDTEYPQDDGEDEDGEDEE